MIENTEMKIFNRQKSASSKENEKMSSKTDNSLLQNSDQIWENEDNCLIKCGKFCGTCCGLLTGIIFTTISILFLIWSPYYILMEQRLNMIEGLPAFEWWKTPPDAVLMKISIFNYTNAEAFLAGNDSKLKVQEIGPIIYLEKLIHKNVTHNNNNTLTYTHKRTAIYLPHENTIDLNQDIIIPNYGVLGVASHIANRNFMERIGFNILLRHLNSSMFQKISLYNFMWNMTDPLLSYAQRISPQHVPSLNIGVLATIYANFEDTSTVYITTKNGHEKFFLLDKFDGSEYLLGHGPSCHERIVNATEGSLYPQYLKKNIRLRYWRKTLCRTLPLEFEKEYFMDHYNVMTYKYTKPHNAYDRKENLTQDCHKGDPILLSGLSDVSKCYNGISMAASFPHFANGDPKLQEYVDGLTPNKSDYDSYTFVEPLTGIPITSAARSQSNFVVKDLTSLAKDLPKFSNLVLPMFWIEYSQEGLPDYVRHMINFTVNIVPTYQYYFIAVMLLIGVLLLIKYVKRIVQNCQKYSKNYKNNTNVFFEQQKFLKN